MTMLTFWDQRYGQTEYVYGKKPNDFLKSVVHEIPKGRVLCLADGEGRNGVFLAVQGCNVTSVDHSSVGLHKALNLAAEHGVVLETVVVDLAEFTIQPNHWDGIVSIFCHLPPVVRGYIHQQVVSGLKVGGVFVLEAYTPQQLQYQTGGPPTAELTMELQTLQQELSGLEFKHGVELEREIQEGFLHQGRSAVVQLLGFKK